MNTEVQITLDPTAILRALARSEFRPLILGEYQMDEADLVYFRAVIDDDGVAERVELVAVYE